MSVHYAIITDLINSPKERATLELTSDVPGAFQFTVYPTGAAPSAQQTVTLNADNFGTTENSAIANLFTASAGLTALVVAMFNDGVSTALLRQKSGTTKIIYYVPPSEQSMGQQFRVPVGDLGLGAYLLVANPNATDVFVAARFGAGVFQDPVQIPAFGVTKIVIPNPNQEVLLVSKTDGLGVVSLLAIDTGKVDITYLTPS